MRIRLRVGIAPGTAATPGVSPLREAVDSAKHRMEQAALSDSLKMPGAIPTLRRKHEILSHRRRNLWYNMCPYRIGITMKTTDIEKRILEIVAEISAITEFVEGSITSSQNYYTLRDGTRKKAARHFKFTSRGARGKQKCTNIPQGAVARIRKLIENGRRYRRLENEYSRLVTEESLERLKKTAGEG